MPPPQIFPCGGAGQPACPPQPTVLTADGALAYSKAQMQAYGQALAEYGYNKGRADALSAHNVADGDTPQG
jgi:hypothetical protein